MKKILLLVLLSSTCLFAQENSYDLPSVIPQSAETASILRYSEVPVSHYNGIPNVNIPIYNLEGRELSVPINMSYHAGGHRVTEEATRVGLGWNLSAGGQITRTVRHNPDDFGNYGYIHTPYVVDVVKNACLYPLTLDQYGNDCVTYTGSAGMRLYDYEPDDFHYNMLGQSGRFMFNQERENNPKGEIVQFPNKNVIITPSYDSFGKITSWVIVDTNGITYEFVEGDKFFSSSTFQTVNNAISVPNSGGSNNSYTETWNLIKVTSANGDVVTFEYDYPVPLGNPESAPNYIAYTRPSQSVIIFDGTVPEPIEYGDDPANHNHHPNTRVTTYNIAYRHYKVLSKISSAKGYVKFVRASNDREDTSPNKQRLQFIQVFNNQDEQLQEIELNHDYFVSSTLSKNEFMGGEHPNSGYVLAGQDSQLNKRLYLKEIKYRGFYEGNVSTNDYKYSFNYNTDVMLPNKRSNSQDHWGYYNGATNFGLVSNTFTVNRTPNPDYSNACVLNEIIYPEGGVTKFNYENNRSADREIEISPYEIRETQVEALTSNQYTITTNGVENTYSFTKTFTISNLAKPSVSNANKVEVNYYSHTDRCENVDVIIGNPADLVCDKMFLKIYKLTNTGQIDPSFNFSTAIRHSGMLLLDKGYTYKVEVEITSTNNDYDLTQDYSQATVKWFDENLSQPASNIVFDYYGGLRIESIKTFDNSLLKTHKSFEYDKGFILSTPDYLRVTPGPTVSISSVSTVPLLNTQSGYVGYQYVTEIQHQVGTDFGFSNLNHGTIGETKIIERSYSPGYRIVTKPEVPNVDEWMAGQLLSVNNSNKQITETSYQWFNIENENDYVASPLYKVKGFKITSNYLLDVLNKENSYVQISNAINGPYNITELIYNLYSAVKLPSVQTTKLIEGSNEITTVSETSYESIPYHFNPTKSKTTDSEGIIHETKMKYPYEVDNTTLLGQNRLNIPVEVEKYKNGVLLQSTKTGFSSFENNFLPEKISASKGNDSLEERIRYINYTSFGQPREVVKTGGTPVTYLWGYDYNYPVAKIENATYQQVNTVINESSIQNLTGAALQASLEVLYSSLPNANINTYIYEPMIGVVLETDSRKRKTYYKYDDLGRLKYILDNELNVISERNYNYKNN